MKNTLATLFAFSIFCNVNLFGQIDSFDLADYKMPDIKIHLIDLSFYFNKTNTASTLPLTSSGSESFSSFHSGNMASSYIGFRNSLAWQKQVSIDQSFRYSRNDTSIPSRNSWTAINFYSTNISIRNIQRKYFKPKLFFEFNQNLGANYSILKSESQNSSSNNSVKNKPLNIQAFIPIKLGIGRIEMVGDARHALFILDKLKKKNVLNRDLSSEEIIQFATLISQLKNKRFFDARIRKIAELTALDTFLQSKDYFTQAGMDYFASMNDLWTFGNNQIRKSGDRFSLAIYPGLSNLKDNGLATFGSSSKSNMYNLHGGLEYTREKPINQIWQNTFHSYLYFGMVKGTYKREQEELKQNIDIPKFNTGFSNTFGYFPNTRTSLEFSINAHYDSFVKRIDLNQDKNGLDGERLFVFTNLDIEYFVSPLFSISIATNLDLFKSYSSFDNNSLDINSLELASYPFCENRSCEIYQNIKKDNKFSFIIAFDFSIF